MINQSRYVLITSGVGAGAVVAARKLILRLITQSGAIPPGIVAEFGNPESVGAYFGMTSEEYRRAQAYFGFINKSIKKPEMISFARFVSADIAPMIIGDSDKKDGRFTGVTAGTLTLAVGGAPIVVSAVNTSTATNLTEVAALIQTAVRAAPGANVQLATAVVTFNTNTNQFILAGGVVGSGTITPTPTGTPADLAPLLGWVGNGMVTTAGQVADTPAVAVAKSASISNNFGSFAFCNGTAPLANSDIADIALWNHSQNNMYLYSVITLRSNMAALYALVKGYSGCAINISSSPLSTDFIEQSPCEIMASTDYSRPAAAQNYMFYQFGARTVTVTDDAGANLADASRCNYIGVTQAAGQPLAFYQRGVLCGDATAATDMGVYSNELWLKSDITASLFSLFLAMPIVPADIQGQGQILAVIQSSIDKARDNGVISIGKTLIVIQKQYITAISADENAWRQIATIGYWLDVNFTSAPNPNSGIVEWQANYVLLYAKKDSIRKVVGSNILI